jgi:adenylate cyclase
MASTRRLAAIFAADVAGYSRLMGTDEEGTLERLKAHRRQLIDPKITEHHGRIVKTTGDGLLVEFASIVDAVRCAAEVQRGMLDREPDMSDERRIRFRIGVNLGDVIAEGGDIFGDGVNVAARLEALAEPGGICVSGTVRDHIRDKLPYPFEDRGEQSVKNIARPLRVYALRPEAVANLSATSVPPEAPHRRRSAFAATAAAVAAAVLVIAVAAWWLWPAAKTSSAPTAAGAASVSQARAAPRLSIVVLPFANLSDDREQQYFADGITEDLTSDLSQIAGMLVISRNTAFTYRNKPVDAKQIGRELDVRYVLEGSVRRSGNQVRVNAQLIEAETNVHLWADRFDRDVSDLFALQNEITGRIAISLNFALVGAEAARRVEHPDALDYIFRGRAAASNPVSRKTHAEAISLFERALALDPHSVEAQLRLANQLVARVLDQMTDTAAADIARADELIGQASAASPNDWRAHFVKGQLLRAQRRCSEAILEYEVVLAANRNMVNALSNLGRCKMRLGLIGEGVSFQEQAIRLSPRDPAMHNWYFRIGEAHLMQSRTEEAIVWLEKSRSLNSAAPLVHAWLASAYALKGETEHAAAELAEARRLGGEGDMSSIARLRADSLVEAPTARTLYETTYLAGLRKAGVPEE